MNKKILITVVLLLVLGIGGFFVMSGKKTSGTSGSAGNSVKTEASQGSAEKKGQNTLKELLTSGIPQSCTFKSLTDEFKSEGTVYTALGKMRGDFTATVNEKEIKSHMIIDNEVSYIWTDGESKGFKTTVTKEQQEKVFEESEDGSGKSGVNLDTKVDYDCKPWIPATSSFEIPGGVEFVSLDDMMKELQKSVSDGCAACDALAGEEKSQCLTALKCN